MHGRKHALCAGQGGPCGLFTHHMNHRKIFRTSPSFVAVGISDQRFPAEHGHRTVHPPSYRWLPERLDIYFGKDTAGMGLDHHLVLPTPRAVVVQAQSGSRTLWSVLGEAAARAGVEALARSGRVLQPEHVLDRFRSLGGFEPVAGAPLAVGRTHSHGWSPGRWSQGEREVPFNPGATP